MISGRESIETLAETAGVLDLALRNTTGSVTAFPFFATNEFYTLGFVDEVAGLVANTVVVNSGNFSMPPPPLEWWQLLWNTIAGWAERAWNAVLAVAEFFRSVGKWLVDFAVGLYLGMTTGNWTYFKDNVLEPFRRALDSFWKWLTDFLTAIVNALFKPIADAITNFLKGLIAPLAAAALRMLQAVESNPGSSGLKSTPGGLGTRSSASPEPRQIPLGPLGQRVNELVEQLRRILVLGVVIGLLLTAIALVLMVTAGIATFVLPFVQGFLIQLLLQAVGAAFIEAGQFLNALTGLGQLIVPPIVQFVFHAVLPGVELAGFWTDLVGFVAEGTVLSLGVFYGARRPNDFPLDLTDLGISVVLLVAGLLFFALERWEGDTAPREHRLLYLAVAIVLDTVSGILSIMDLFVKRKRMPPVVECFTILTLMLDAIGLMLGATEFVLVAAQP